MCVKIKILTTEITVSVVSEQLGCVSVSVEPTTMRIPAQALRQDS